MQLSSVVLVCLVSLVHIIAAQAIYKTSSICTTLYGTKSVSPKSTGYQLTIPITFQKKTTVTPTVTVTPPPVSTTTTSSTTSTVFETTTPTETITSTSTETSTFTDTATSISTTGIVTTTTTTPPATTVSASAGFTPLSQEPGYVPKKRSLEDVLPAIRGRLAQPIEGRAAAVTKCPAIGGPKQFTPALYPTSTLCGTLVQAITTTTKTYTATTKATTTLAPSTITSTATTTFTTTQTVAGAPSLTTSTTTITTSTTTTTTTTTTVTTTDTQTVAAPTPTVYGQCQSNNVVGAANGNQAIYQPGYAAYNGVSINQVGITDPTACCAQCQTTAGCVGFGQYPNGPCYYFTVDPSGCDGSSTFDDIFTTNSGYAAGAGYFVGNGQCGRLGNGGSVG